MSRSELISDARVVMGGTVVPGGWILIEDGVIGDVGSNDRRPPAADVRTSAAGTSVLPGFVDIHVHGGGGGTFGSDAASTAHALNFHLNGGTTSLLAGISTCAPDVLLENVKRLSAFPDEPHLGSRLPGSRLLGIHLEGPFISTVRKGAHDPRLIRPPDPLELSILLDAAPGRIRLLTAAPELPGFDEVARVAQNAGVVIGAGHTDADGPQFRAAIEAGAKTLTHTFNGMRPVLHRSPGPMEAIVDTGVFCELICDGVHVHPTFVRMLRRLVGQHRLVLVTDAARWAGAPNGEYEWNSRLVDVRDGAVFLRGTETLSGSTLTMAEAARRYVRFTGADLVELAAVTATNAARVLGEDDRIGLIKPGRQADLVFVDGGVNCVGVMSAGRWVRRLGDPYEHVAPPPGQQQSGSPFAECPNGHDLGTQDEAPAPSGQNMEP
jgi:N-acetylglucosamine-6-phosphate deacetylase